MEISMNNRPDPDQIAEEAVGQGHSSPPPDAVKEKDDMSPDDAPERPVALEPGDAPLYSGPQELSVARSTHGS